MRIRRVNPMHVERDTILEEFYKLKKGESLEITDTLVKPQDIRNQLEPGTYQIRSLDNGFIITRK